MKASNVVAFALAVGLVLGGSGAAGAVGSDAPGLQFDGDKAVEVNATKATDVIVVNTTTAALTLTPSASLAVDGEVVPLGVEASVDVLEPGASAALTIQAVPATLTTAAPGSLTIVGKPETGAAVSAWRPLSFAPPKKPVAAPVTDSIAVDADADGDVPTVLVPVQDGSCADLLGSETTTKTGYITSGSDIATVTYSCDGKQLSIAANTKEPGTYSGKIKVGDATVSLKVTDHWPLAVALLAAIAGIAVGAWQQARAAVTRPVALAKTRVRAVAEQAETAQEEFRKARSGPSDRVYDLIPGARIERLRLLDAFDASLPKGRRPERVLRSFVQSGPDAEAFKAATARLETFDQVVDGWPDAAAALNDLDAKLEAVDALDDSLTTFPVDLVAHAQKLARPEGTDQSVSITSAAKVADEARRTARVLGILPKLTDFEADLQAIAERLDEDAATLPGDREVLASGFRSYRQLSALLLAAKGVGAGADDKLLALSARVEAAIQQLTVLERVERPEPTEDAQRRSGFDMACLRARVPLPGIGPRLDFITDGLVDVVSGVRRRLGADLTTIRAVDFLMFLLAAALALVTALAAQFVGKPWGGAFDVVAFFVWGIGAIAVGTPLLTALRSVGEVSPTAEPAAAEAKKSTTPKGS